MNTAWKAQILKLENIYEEDFFFSLPSGLITGYMSDQTLCEVVMRMILVIG